MRISWGCRRRGACQWSVQWSIMLIVTFARTHGQPHGACNTKGHCFGCFVRRIPTGARLAATDAAVGPTARGPEREALRPLWLLHPAASCGALRCNESHVLSCTSLLSGCMLTSVLLRGPHEPIMMTVTEAALPRLPPPVPVRAFRWS